MEKSFSTGIYVHWPFCMSKCPYCDFNSHVRKKIDYHSWKLAFAKEIAYVRQQSGPRDIESIFFGGGTPSLMPSYIVEEIISQLYKHYRISKNVEITLEGNPNSIEVENYYSFYKAGINRVSIGVQSLNDNSLKFLERSHNVNEALKALDIAKSLFSKVSFDLIYTLPEQKLDKWGKELEYALTLAKGHLSLYQLTIEPNTIFYARHKRGDFCLPSEEISAHFWELTNDILVSHNYKPYEVSNYAKKQHQCKHNLIYWQYKDYLCIGPGAHGRVSIQQQKYAIKNYRLPEQWLKAVMDKGNGQEEKKILLAQEQIIEHIIMNLRLYLGINKQDFYNQHQQHLINNMNNNSINYLSKLNLVKNTPNYFKVTKKGMLYLNYIIEQLIPTF